MKDNGDAAFVIRDPWPIELVAFALERLVVQDTGLIDRIHMRHHQNSAPASTSRRPDHDIRSGTGRRLVSPCRHAQPLQSTL